LSFLDGKPVNLLNPEVLSPIQKSL